MAENTDLQTIADNFAEHFTDEDLLLISQKTPEQLKAFLAETCLLCLEFAEENTGKQISILPGRPSRPSKPTV